ncbi:hypothetical protein [Kribbella sp. NPDC050470]|uniref:hypothetical protein n=1 Tax=unclassified Kribbella TaxID=2644121 RepID=UPI0037B5186B
MSEPIRVVNAGTAENPNFFGSAYEMGRLQGVRDALEALKTAEIHDGYEYDECVAAVEALIPK